MRFAEFEPGQRLEARLHEVTASEIDRRLRVVLGHAVVSCRCRRAACGSLEGLIASGWHTPAASRCGWPNSPSSKAPSPMPRRAEHAVCEYLKALEVDNSANDDDARLETDIGELVQG